LNRQPLFAEERKEEIVRLLGERSKLLLPELCQHFDVSPATIRNDLRDLDRAGRLKRTHGGAIPVSKAVFEPTSRDKEAARIEEKRRIAAYAESLIEDGDTILLDTGTTTMELAKRLTTKTGLTIVTNDVKIALFLEENTSTAIFLLGGMLRRNFHSTTGLAALAQVSDLHVDKAFMAGNGLCVENGFTTPSMDQAGIKKAMIAAATRVIFLLDSQKFGQVSFTQFADLQDAHTIITDTGANEGFIDSLQAKQKDLEVCIV